MRRWGGPALVLAVVALAGVPRAAGAARNPACRDGTTLALVGTKATCLRAGVKCRTAVARDYRAAGYACRKRRGRGARLVLGSAARRRGDFVAVSPSGRMALASAEQAYVAAIGPLPGVRREPGAVGAVRSGTGPLAWLRAHRRRLSGPQRRALAADEAALFGARGARAAGADVAGAQKAVDAAIEGIYKHLPGLGSAKLEIPAKVVFGSAGGGALAVTTIEKGTCLISVTAAGRALPAGELVTSLEHEAFHCYEFSWNADGYGEGADWVYEGGANWAAALLDVDRGYVSRLVIGGWLSKWLATPGYPLFSRTYGAVGFFAHLDESGADFWKLIRPMTEAAPDSLAAYRIALADGAMATRMLDTWGPSYHRITWPGPGWTFTAPAMPGDRPAVAKATVHDGNTVAVPALAGAAAIRDVVLDADVTVVSGGAHGRLVDAGGTQQPLEARTYCTRSGGCECPDGRPGPPDRLREHLLVGVTGHETVAIARFTGRSLEDWCKSAPAGGRVEVSGPLAATITAVGDCSIDSDGALSVILSNRAQPTRLLQMDARHYDGPGSYPATGRGVTSQPTVFVTDGYGHSLETAKAPEGAEAGGFTVTSETGSQLRGTVDATMWGDGGETGHASGTWVCNRV